MREKLIELLKNADDLPVVEAYDTFADYLIENGVTISVRCKECKAYDKEVGYCEAMGFTCEADDFCSYGERKDNERKTD